MELTYAIGCGGAEPCTPTRSTSNTHVRSIDNPAARDFRERLDDERFVFPPGLYRALEARTLKW